MTVPIGSDGSFSLSDLASPAEYVLTIAKPGFAADSQRIDIGGGEDRAGVQLRLRTGDGLISGMVIGPDGPVGGAVVTATTGTATVKTVSLTKGTVGSFTLRGLVTPGSYTVTVTADGFSTQTAVLTLAAGQRFTGAQVPLTRSSGAISGAVTTISDSKPAAGVAVTVTAGDTTVQTVTQSTGTVGAWTVAGLPIPGTYTVTFTRADLQSQTLVVTLDGTGQASSGELAVAMRSAFAVVSGTVTQRDLSNTVRPVGEATVTLSSGTETYTVTTSSVPSQRGSYRLEGIVPGTYTLSASRPGTTPTTVTVTLVAGQESTQSPVLIQPAGIAGTITSRDSTGVSGLQVDLYQSARYPAEVYRTTTTDTNGHYEFANVDAPQAYVVEVRSAAAGALGSATLVLTPSQAGSLDLIIGDLPTTTTTTTTGGGR